MNRQEHEDEVRNKIIKATRRLFIEQGYHQTTIRQIQAKANVKTGTLYHFYKNKEDIFYNVVRQTFFRTQKYTQGLVGKNNKILHLACEMAWHIHLMSMHAPSAELYLMSYNSPRIAANMIEEQALRSQAIFKETANCFTSQDHEMRAMMTKGFLQSVAQRAVQGKLKDAKMVIKHGINLSFGLFDVSKKDINKMLNKLEKLNIEAHIQKFINI